MRCAKADNDEGGCVAFRGSARTIVAPNLGRSAFYDAACAERYRKTATSPIYFLPHGVQSKAWKSLNEQEASKRPKDFKGIAAIFASTAAPGQAAIPFTRRPRARWAGSSARTASASSTEAEASASWVRWRAPRSQSGGRVTGIIPGFLTEKEKMLRDVDDLILTEDMHERKRLMFERSDAFVALPGGVGTLEELVEQLTWVQLGRHAKPVVVANIAGFWNPFLSLLTHMKAETFIRPGLDLSFTVVDDAMKIVPAVLASLTGAEHAKDETVLAKF